MSKITDKNYKAIKTYLTKHSAKEASTKFELGIATVYAVNRSESLTAYRKTLSEATKQSRDRKKFTDSFKNYGDITLMEQQNKEEKIITITLIVVAIGVISVLVRSFL